MHPFLTATRHATEHWYCNADDRLAPQPSPGIVELRVARAHIERALGIVQTVIDRCEAAGLEAAAVEAGRRHRAGVGIGRAGRYTPIRVKELRERVSVTETEINEWLAEHPRRMVDEWRLRHRGFHVRADGRLRLLLPRRHDRAPDPCEGWRWSFTDQVGRRLEEQILEVVAALGERSGS